MSREPDGQRPREMVHGGLARGVGIALELGDAKPVDGADVDDARRIARPTALLQQREKRLGEVEDRLDVDRQHLVPGRLRVLGERGAPGGAGIVHEDVQRRLARADLPRPGDYYCTGAVFERCGWVATLILDPQISDA